MPTLAECSVDSIVTDPPYGLAFMGKDWDHSVPGERFWREAMRVAKPGAHLLAFGGTRTFHRLACAIEDAGWEIRDTVMWVYGSGFPKSLDVGKAIDKAAGMEREVLGYTVNARPNRVGKETKLSGLQTIGGEITAPATVAARQWQGWGTALKPAWEPIIVARKPLDGTVAENVQRWGTGAVNVDGCRVSHNGSIANANSGGQGAGYDAHNTPDRKYGNGLGGIVSEPHSLGRWPANLIHDGSDEVCGLFPSVKAGVAVNSKRASQFIPNEIYGKGWKHSGKDEGYGDSGSAARFFYCAKASKADRDAGVAGVAGVGALRDGGRQSMPRKNHHPTVKPHALMRYLCRLVTPPGGVVLDPFCGSGSTGKAAKAEGFGFVGVELSPDYCEIARARMGVSVLEGVA
jgi:DNA modification methylase